MGRIKVNPDDGALVAAVDGEVVGPLRVAGLPVTAEDCLRLAHVVSVALQAHQEHDLPRMGRVGRPRQKARAYLAWEVARWTATKTADGEPYWRGVAAFMRTAGLDHGRESLHYAGERLRLQVYRMLRDVAGTSLSGRNARDEFRTAIAPRR